MEHVEPLLAAWESFYVIIGSSSAALIGLQFVVIVLSAEMNILGSDATTSAFATPTIVHFCAVLFIAAILSAPWPTLTSANIVLGACGLAGLVYTVMVVRQTRRQTDYVPVLEDWLSHAALPLGAYTVLLITSFLLQQNPMSCLFVIGGVVLVLLFVGIHNAWDSVVFIAITRRKRAAEPEQRDEQP